MHNAASKTPSDSEVKNPSPEADRGQVLSNCDIPYGYKQVIKLRSYFTKNGDLYYLALIRDPSVSSCDELSVHNENLKKMKKNKKTKKNIFPLSNGLNFLDIHEEGCLMIPDYKKLVSDAKLAQRLSDNDLGGGLGKKKRLNRMISQGTPERYSGRKKKCPLALEERIAQKSSLSARSLNLRNAQDYKMHNIQPQALGLGFPSMPIEAGPIFQDLACDLMDTIREKKIDVADDFKKLIEQLSASMGNLSDVKVTHGFNFSNLVPPVTHNAVTVPYLVGLLLVVIYLCIKDKKVAKGLIALSSMAILLVPHITPTAKMYYDRVVDWASGSTLCDQDEICEQSLSSTIVDSVIAFMYYGHAKSVSWDKDPVTKLSNFFSRTRDMRKVRDGVEFTFASALSYFQSFVDWLSETFGLRKFDVTMDGRPEITVYSDKVTALLKCFSEGKILNCESAKDVMSIYSEGLKIAKALPNSPEYADSRRLIQSTMSELSPLMLKIRRSNLHNNGPRIQPVGVFLTGPPGVGKTTAITPMMLEVTARTIPVDQIDAFRANHNDFIYNRLSENVYYDSYIGQYNVLCDDLGQTTDVAGVNNNPYMEFIRMVNSNSMDLHMAHLDDKGTTGFRAKFVWATSNVNKFNLKSIVNAGALTRRFTCSYMVVPAKGYREDEEESDFWKMRLRGGVEFLEGSPHLDFYEYDALTGTVLSQAPLTMRQVTENIIIAHDVTQKFGRKVLDLHEDCKNAALSKRLDESQEIVPQSGGNALPLSFRYGETLGQLASRISAIDKGAAAEKLRREQSVEVDVQKDFVECSKDVLNRLLVMSSQYKASILHTFHKLSDYSSIINCVETLKKIIAGIAIFTSGYGLYKLMSSGVSPDEESGPYVHNRTGLKPNRNRSQRVFKPSLLRKHGKIRSQLAFDATCDDIMYKIYKKNVYTLHQSTTSSRIGSITFIGGHDAFMPRHFAEGLLSKVEDGLLSPDFSVVLRAASNPDVFFEFAFKDIQFYFPDEWENEDVCFARFPNVLPQSPDIRKYIMEDSDVIVKKFSGKMLKTDAKGSLHVPFTYMDPVSDLPYTNYVNPVAFSYAIPTQDGDCGNLIFVSNPLTGSHKVIGQHVAGAIKSGTGFASRITQSYVRSYDQFMSKSPMQIVEPEIMDKEFTTDEILPQSFKTLFKDRKANPPLSSSIIPSPLLGTFSPTTCAPAKLRPFASPCGEVIDPWIISRAKYAKPSYYMDSQVLQQCTFSYGSKINNVSTNDSPWEKRVFTFEEAVAGVPGVPNCEGIPRNTSSGYPFCLDVPPSHKGKSHFFGRGDDYEFTSPHCIDLKKRVHQIISFASKGQRLTHIYFDFLKDERRPISKVDKGSTRLVSASPVDLLIATRMYFMDFVRWYMNNRIINGSAVGINPFSTEWSALRRNLCGSTFDKNIVAGDFQAYDASLTRQIQLCFLDFVNRWYNDGNDLIRAVLFEDVCNSKHIYGDIVYEWPGGNPSGCFLTTILNTFCNNVILRYAGVMCHDQLKYGDGIHIVSDHNKVSRILGVLENQLFIQAYGDDNIISVGEGIRDWFNQRSLTKAFAKFGFVYTSEDKSDDAHDLRSIDEVSFLKRSWVYDTMVHTHVAALSMDTILEMSQWTKKNDKDFSFVKVNVDTTLKELSAHGDVMWDKWAKKIMAASEKELGYMSPIANRRHALSLQLSRDSVDQ